MGEMTPRRASNDHTTTKEQDPPMTEHELRTRARDRALIAGAVYRKEIPAPGTRVHLSGNHGRPTAAVYRVVEIRRRGGGYQLFVESTPQSKKRQKIWIAAELVTPAEQQETTDA